MDNNECSQNGSATKAELFIFVASEGITAGEVDESASLDLQNLRECPSRVGNTLENTLEIVYRERIATESGDLGFIIARRAHVSVFAWQDSINAKVFRDSSLLRRLPAINRYRRHRSRSGEAAGTSHGEKEDEELGG
ncbi:hypothetical protein WN51_04343 [Melipona quadrifasciata]|uniref:Uncharacterized protein n=1 Tax=Melipona quadrifasciata TaxID=166423 RepID=A0A0M8ZSW4_9HYME|nr:hypothetical protein WN51_04343 [Melipona quadrifasciata]